MEEDIHPEHAEIQATCTYGNSFTTRSTLTSGEVCVDVCPACHPFYIGEQKISDTTDRVSHFEAHYTKYNTAKRAVAKERAVEVKKAASEATIAK